jgi:Dolichyl-phosphate-mannose-protein mannosyltransferase
MTSGPKTTEHRFSITENSKLRTLGTCVAIFLVAFGVRVLVWHDTRLEVGKIQTVVTADYKRVAQLLSEGGVRSFFSSSSPLADLNNLGHPPGYSILLAIIFGVFGQSDTAIQFVQIFADAFAVVLIFLIAAELFPLSAGVVAAVLAAFSPQLAWNSVLLLPDSICVLPLLIAIYLLARATKPPRLITFIIAGGLIGISCWLRANAMLLTFFAAAAVLLMIKPTWTTAGRRSAGAPAWRFAGAIIAGTLLIILPLTTRNAIVFHRFIPLSLGAGQTFLEGLADYDPQGRFSIPRTDMGIMKQEAEIYRRSDYYGTLFNPDGVERERARLSRGLAVVRSHPLWFAGVMARRASSMVRLERSRLISSRPSITNQIRPSPPTSVVNADELVTRGIRLSPAAQLAVVFDGQDITVSGDASQYGAQFGWPIRVRSDVDYLVQIPVRMERGRMRMSVLNSHGGILSSAVAETAEDIAPPAQPITLIKLPFVADDSNPRLVVSNEASANPFAEMGPVEIYELGPARFLWTRYPRLVIHGIQKIFITAVILPLAIFGLLVVILKKQKVALILLSIVPIYYFTVQSLVHTEYRYVLAVNYFLFAFAGIFVSWLYLRLRERVKSN